MDRCRICLKTPENVRGLKGKIRNMVCDVLQISITANDRFPKKICRKCHSVVLSAHKLRMLAAKSQSLLLSEEYALNDISIVKEEVVMEYNTDSNDITIKEECITENTYESEDEYTEFADTSRVRTPRNVKSTEGSEDRKGIDHMENPNLPDDMPLAKYCDISHVEGRESSSNDLSDVIEEDSDDVIDCDVFILPPNPAILTDEDSGDEDEDDGANIKNLNHKHLLADTVMKPKTKLNQLDVDDTAEDILSQRKFRYLVGKGKRTWIKGEMESFLPTFPELDYSQFKNKSATQLFELFFDDNIVGLLAEETNKYAQHKNKSISTVTLEEIRCFVGILILTGYNVVPSTRLLWSSKLDTRNELVCQAMRRNRFDEILRFIHCVDNATSKTEDKMWKIRPFMNLVQKNLMKCFTPERNLSFDKSMIKYYGRRACKQFVSGKPIRFGYKAWCLCTSSGYLINFDVYQGKCPPENSVYDKHFGTSTAPLIRMIDEFDDSVKKLPYHFTFDKVFTGFNLLSFLRNEGYGGTGTIRENCIPKNNIFTPNVTLKKKHRGYHESAISKEDGVIVCKLVDNSVVSLASNINGVHPIETVKRYSGKEKHFVQVRQPFILKEYNKAIFGVDRMDENINSYRINAKNKKWYWPIFSWMIDVCVQNAWQLARKSGNEISHLDFRQEIVEVYLNKYNNIPIKGFIKPSSKSKILNDIRFDGLNHYVQKIEKKRRCAGLFCKQKNSKVRTQCVKCNVGLCIICFEHYHTIL